jgi:hypothetical protein
MSVVEGAAGRLSAAAAGVALAAAPGSSAAPQVRQRTFARSFSAPHERQVVGVVRADGLYQPGEKKTAPLRRVSIDAGVAADDAGRGQPRQGPGGRIRGGVRPPV